MTPGAHFNDRLTAPRYCGCAYSLRDSNLWRLEQGMGPIEVGGDYRYTDPVADAAEESREVVDTFFSQFDHRNQVLRPKRRRAALAATPRDDFK